MTTTITLKLRVALLVAASLLIASCKKDNGGGGSSSSKVSLLTSGEWKMQDVLSYELGKWVTYGPGSGWDTVTFTFKSDGTFAESDDSNASSGTWQINASGQLLIIGGEFMPGTWNIGTLTSASLVLVDLKGDYKNELAH